MKKEKFLKLLSRKLSGELSAANSEILDQAIENNEEYRLLASKLGHYFNDKKIPQLEIDQLNHTWERITAVEKEHFIGNFDYSAPKKSRVFHSTLFKVAAALLLFIGSGWLGYHLLNHHTNLDFNTLTATNQKIFKILDDGTKIWLNKKSSISFNKTFGKHKREIFLEGEAYFDVVKNKAVPLFIHAKNIDIEVKGTAFNVKAYKQNPEIQVALIRGSIQVTDRLHTKHQVLLKPNEKLIFSNSASNGSQNNFQILPLKLSILLKETNWTSDTLVFYKEKLKDLVVRMEKKYDLKIEVHSEQLREKRFSGTFTNETIQQALAALKLSYPLTYTISDRLVVIKD
jgi:transmembrane sensor